jgi:hypothetical protein
MINSLLVGEFMSHLPLMRLRKRYVRLTVAQVALNSHTIKNNLNNIEM